MVSRAALDELKASYRNWNKTKAGSGEQFLALFADDFSMGSLAAGTAGMEFSREHTSREQARSYFAELLKDWTMLFFHVRDFVVQGSEVAVICECCWRHNRTGQIVHSPKLDLWRFKGRKAVDFFEFFDTDQAIGACVECGPVTSKEPKPLYAASGAKVHDGLTEAARGNLRKLKAFYKAYDRTKGTNFADGIALLAPKVDWMSLANGSDGAAFTVRRATPAEVEQYFKGLYGEWEMLGYDVDRAIAGGPFVIVHGAVSFKNKRTGKMLSTPKADCFRFARGKIVEFMEYYDTAAMMRAVS